MSDELSKQFEMRASERGWKVIAEGTDRRINCGWGCLRWRCGADVAILEITHGPSESPAFGWLELWSNAPDPCPESPTLADCIDYGLELMGVCEEQSAAGSGKSPPAGDARWH